MARRVAVGADHGGFELKGILIDFLNSKGYIVKDFGTFSADSCDYPDYSFSTSEAVAGGEFDFGLLICRSGIGMAICANKVPGIRAGCCENTAQAKRARRHNDANVLVLAGDYVNNETAKEVLLMFLETPFEGGRHLRRVKLINDYDAKRISHR
ncbi:MAG: ribose 5-phosphate isomerase B [Candidatus Omnitrophica bacterium]|nr:ribose 5-phosphate isomerase B [Candidatus Omnitrophota bacterium]